MVADRQARTLAAMRVSEAGARLVLDWTRPVDHGVFYKSVFRPAVLRANRLALPESEPNTPAGAAPSSSPQTGSGSPAETPAALGGPEPLLPPGLKFHALRHTYASLCVAAGIAPLDISRVHGPQPRDDHARGLRASIRFRSRRLDGRARGHEHAGYCSERGSPSAADVGLSISGSSRMN